MPRITKKEKKAIDRFTSCIHSGWSLDLSVSKDLKRTHTGYCNHFDCKLNVVSVCLTCFNHKSYREPPVIEKTEPQKARISRGRRRFKNKIREHKDPSIDEFLKKVS